MTNKNVRVSIDGAHIKTKNTVQFDRKHFCAQNDLRKTDVEQARRQGEYCIDGHDAHIIISSVPGIGDVNIEADNGIVCFAESKKGTHRKNSAEYALMRKAIDQLMTGIAFGQGTNPVVTVPDAEKSRELADRRLLLPQIKNAGICFFPVKEDGDLRIIE